MTLKFRVIPVTPLQQNCTLLICTETNKAAVIDPGGDLHLIEATIHSEQVQLEKIWITHGHLDHAGGTLELSQRFGIPIEGPHRDDNFWIQAIPNQCQLLGFQMCQPFTPTRWLEEGDRVTIGNLELQVLHCPGHTPGHLVFYHPQSRWAQVGDVIFSNSVGRSDLPGGDPNALLNSIRNKLFKLGNDVNFVCGHGPMSSFGAERLQNPFVKDILFATG